MAARRRVVERKQPAPFATEPAEDVWEDLKPVLDQELTQLSDKYRVVLVACDLQGQTRQQAARQLGLPEGTIASRLARGREMLAKRLKRRKVTLSAITLGILFADHVAEPVPPRLADFTVSAAARLAAGKSFAPARVAELSDRVVAAMSFSKGTIAAAVFAMLALFVVGVSALMPAASAQRDVLEPGKPKPEMALHYVLQNIDAVNGFIEARSSDSFSEADVSLLCLRVDKNTAIRIDGKDARLDELQCGHVVDLCFERSAAGPHQALRVEATGESVVGTVLARNDDSLTIEGELKGDKFRKTYEVKTADTYVDSKKVKLAKIKSGMKVTVFVPFGKPGVVNKVDAVGLKKVGVLKAVDPKKPAVRVAFGEPAEGHEEVAIVAEAPVLVDGKKSGLTALAPGMTVTLQMSAEAERGYAVGVVAQTAGKDR